MTSSDPPVLSVIAPCFNEQDNVPVLVARTLATFDDHGIDGELVLVDDGSSDATWERIEAAMATHDRVRGTRHPQNRGIEGGWNSGLATARADLVCLIDSDLQNRPEDIARLFACHQRDKPDMVQAVRHPKDERSRIVFSRALKVLLNITFGMRLRDNKSGFILCRREVLEDILRHRYDYRYFQSFIGVAAGVRGYRIAEVDTTFDARHAGQSFLSRLPVRASAQICVELVKYRVETWNLRSR
jgi:phenylacetate-CoA ligase